MSSRDRRIVPLIVALLCLGASLGASRASAREQIGVLRDGDPPRVTRVRWFPTGDAGVGRPSGMTYSRELDALVMFGIDDDDAWLARVTPREDLLGITPITDVSTPSSLAFDPERQSITGFTGPTMFDIEVGDLTRSPESVYPRYISPAVGRPMGAVHAWDDAAFVLDAATRELVHFADHGQRRTDLRAHGEVLGGLAFDTSGQLLYVAALDRGLLLGLNQQGAEMTRYDISHLGLLDVTAMAFGLTADPTDDPSFTSLYLLEPHEDTAHVIEVSLPPYELDDGLILPGPGDGPIPGVGDAPVAGVDAHVASLIKSIDLSRLSPPSPDSAGVAYLPGADRIMVSDSEVEEMSIYRGANLFRLRRDGTLVDTGTTTSFSNEPTGLGFDAANNRLIVSDDDADQISLMLPGADTRFGTSDDTVTEFGVSNSDSEGVAYDSDQRQIFIVDGVGREVYRINPGPNGTYGNSDDIGSNFDVGGFGAGDPEGIAYDARFGTLLVLDHKTETVYEVDKQGTLLRTIDISAASPTMAAGIEIAPSSANINQMSLWIVDRGIDNCSDSSENDGKLYEMTTGGSPPPPNTQPSVSISAPADGTQFPSGAQITFTGSATDTEDGNLTSTIAWESDKQGSIGTGGSFTRTLDDGAHSITARVTDTAGVSATDSVSIVVGDVPLALDVRAAASSDDAEEQPSGSVKLSSSDLELGLDRSTPQTVGIRFPGVPLPAGATVTNAYVQFTVDEASSGPSSLALRGQASDNAATFTSATGNVTTRPRTTTSVDWSPPDWPTVAAAGAAQRTPDLSAILNEIIGRPGWASGNGLALFVAGTGTRVADAAEGGSGPLLHVEYRLTPVTGPPTVQITAPADGSSHPLGSSISFSGTATDPDDGPVTSSLVWTSDLDGPIGTGGSFSTVLSAGTHIVRAVATDSDANTGEAWVTVIVENQRPVVQITAPADGASFPSGASVTFTGTASDAEQGSLTSALSWSSSLDGSLGTGGTVNRSLSDGTHTITATVTDTQGATGQDSIEVFVGASPTTTVLSVQSSANDAEEQLSNGRVRDDSGDLDLVEDKGTAQLVGIRYAAPIPAGATILSATIQFHADEADSAPASLTFHAQASDNAPAITTATGNLTSRPTTGSSVGWSPGAWSGGQAGPAQQTPDLSTVIQSVVDRPGWTSGAHLLILIAGSGERAADSFDGGPPPVLTVEWV